MQEKLIWSLFFCLAVISVRYGILLFLEKKLKFHKTIKVVLDVVSYGSVVCLVPTLIALVCLSW